MNNSPKPAIEPAPRNGSGHGHLNGHLSPQQETHASNDIQIVDLTQRAPYKPWLTQRVVWSIWLMWCTGILGFQTLVVSRFDLQKPDRSFYWVERQTTGDVYFGKPYLDTGNKYLNSHVAWDSEYYISIALAGYNDPNMRFVVSAEGRKVTMNHAFFPVYPLAMRLVSTPLRWIGIAPHSAVVLGGILVSLLGACAAMFALFHLVRDQLDDRHALRSIYYFLVFPSALFLAQVYTEGLFLAFSFGSLMFMGRKQWAHATVLGMLAIWTRPSGICLAVPFAYLWLRDFVWTPGQTWKQVNVMSIMNQIHRSNRREMVIRMLPIACLFGAFLAWYLSPLGTGRIILDDLKFKNGFLIVLRTLNGYRKAFLEMATGNNQAIGHFIMEFAITGFGLFAVFKTYKKFPAIALYGLATWVTTVFGGYPASKHRYMLAIPSIFILLGVYGKSPLFDKIWSMVSILLMALLTVLFSFSFWAG